MNKSDVKYQAYIKILENVKSVIMPNTNHLKGIPAAAAAGIIAGKPEWERGNAGN